MIASNGIEYVYPLSSSEHQAVVRYTLRGLSEDEIDSWSRFCEQVFADKKPHPPLASYFARHYYNDPHREASLVRVATIMGKDDDDNDDVEHIVASCRVFRRTIASPLVDDHPGEGKRSGTTPRSIDAGGIGEVCTAVDHRRRGLSSQLLLQAISAMTSHGHESSVPPTMPTTTTTTRNSSMELSFLHSAPTFFPVYHKAGYTSIRSRWSVIDISLTNGDGSLADDDSRGETIRTARFPDDTASLQAMHRQYSESRFVGCIIRSEAYWNEYLSKELEETLFVMTAGEDASTILGWMSIRSRNDRYQLREFGCTSRAAVSRVFLPLLNHALSKHLGTAYMMPEGPIHMQLHLPTAVWEDLTSQGPMEWIGKVEQEDDLGWMYKSEKAIQFNTEKDHLIWPSDSF